MKVYRPEMVTSRSARESSARALGLRRRDLESVWNAIVSLYRTGLHPAISVCVRYRGSVVLERSIGHARGNQPDAPSNESKILATPDTRFNFYSGSKCVTIDVIVPFNSRRFLVVAAWLMCRLVFQSILQNTT